MYTQTLAVFLLLSIATQAKYYGVTQTFQITEIPEEVADFGLHDPKLVAFVEFRDDRNISGWTYYYFKSDNSTPDWQQMYYAGYMEGFTGYTFVWDAWLNDQLYIANATNTDVIAFVANQFNWIKEMIYENQRDNYWQLVNATLNQFYGMYEGYTAAIKGAHRPDMTLTFDQFYALTNLMDLLTVMRKFNNTEEQPLKCSFLAKLTEENLFVSHTTWFSYTALIRTYKILDFELQNPLVKTKRMSYSSQPGYVTSQDDFYILDNARVVTETSLKTFNPEAYSFLHYDSVPYWIRVTVANLVFDNQQDWTDAYFNYRSGTYNNQWLLIDFNNYNKSKANLSEAKDIIWLVEEFFSLTSAQDLTQDMLVPTGYVASYNTPYAPEIQNLSQYTTNYTDDPRAILFKKYAPGIQNADDFKAVMRMNNHSDTGDYCQAISSRCDLNSTTNFPRGALDAKVTNEIMAPSHQAWIIAGPSSQDLPPFDWGNWSQYANYSNGMPNVFNFDWVFMDPNTNFSANIPQENNELLAYEEYYNFIKEVELLQ